MHRVPIVLQIAKTWTILGQPEGFPASKADENLMIQANKKLNVCAKLRTWFAEKRSKRKAWIMFILTGS